MDSVRAFVRLWLLLGAGVLVYAWLDLRLNPELLGEVHYSLKPDLQQIPDLVHWGGRLLNHGAHGLLIGNALILAGIAALLTLGAAHTVRRLRRNAAEPRVSIVPASVPISVPPTGTPE